MVGVGWVAMVCRKSWGHSSHNKHRRLDLAAYNVSSWLHMSSQLSISCVFVVLLFIKALVGGGGGVGGEQGGERMESRASPTDSSCAAVGSGEEQDPMHRTCMLGRREAKVMRNFVGRAWMTGIPLKSTQRM